MGRRASLGRMDADLLSSLFGVHGPLVTRTTAVAYGVPAAAIDRLVRTGAWTAVRRGVYADTSYVTARRHRADRQRLVDDAACLRITRPHVRSHESAAVVLGLPVLLGSRPITHVTRPDVRGARHEHGVKHHMAPYAAAQVLSVGGILVLDHARTALDVAREHGLVAGVVAMDSALRAGVPHARLRSGLAAMSCWPGSTVMRAALERCDAGSDSVAETLGRLLVEQLGRGRPETQFGLRCDGRTAFADLRVGRHLIEVDGRLKYLPGAAAVDPHEVLWEEKRRQDWLCGFKLGMSRLTWTDGWPPGQPAVLARLERELTDTEQRFGTDITDLTPHLTTRPAPTPAP